MPMLKYGSYSLRNIYIYSICHPQADIEALTMQEQNLDERIKLVTSYLKTLFIVIISVLLSMLLLCFLQ